jgi:hypothetical protein
MSEILQEVSTEREIEIPEPVRDVYKLWRPTPLRGAQSLERLLDTPARIFYKDKSSGPTGSFKPNEAVPEAFYIREAGAKKKPGQAPGNGGPRSRFASEMIEAAVTDPEAHMGMSSVLNFTDDAHASGRSRIGGKCATAGLSFLAWAGDTGCPISLHQQASIGPLLKADSHHENLDLETEKRPCRTWRP